MDENERVPRSIMDTGNTFQKKNNNNEINKYLLFKLKHQNEY